MKLNIGSGEDIREGWINLDLHKRYGANLIFDLSDIYFTGKRMPFLSDSVDYIYCGGILEDFLYEYVAIMNELHRILKPGGTLHILVPYGIQAQNPHHKRIFMPDSFYYFIDYYSPYVTDDIKKFSKLTDLKIHRKNKLWDLSIRSKINKNPLKDTFLGNVYRFLAQKFIAFEKYLIEVKLIK